MVVEYEMALFLKCGKIVGVCAVYRICAVDSSSVIENGVDNTCSNAVLHYRT
jgi:hypothetical protein